MSDSATTEGSYTAMNREIGEKWVAALLSGEYRQGKGKLHWLEDDRIGGSTYCCLGVLCEVAVENPEWVPRPTSMPTETDDTKISTYSLLVIGNYEDSLIAPLPILRITELEDGNPYFKVPCVLHKLECVDYSGAPYCVGCQGKDTEAGYRIKSASTLNDTDGFTFEQIAHLVQTQLVDQNGDGSIESAQRVDYVQQP